MAFSFSLSCCVIGQKEAKAAAKARQRRRSRFSGAVAAQPFGFELGLIECPFLLMAEPKLMKIVPGKESGRMQIIEDQPHRVGADRLDPGDAALALAANGQAVFPPVALNLCTGAHDP